MPYLNEINISPDDWTNYVGSPTPSITPTVTPVMQSPYDYGTAEPLPTMTPNYGPLEEPMSLTDYVIGLLYINHPDGYDAPTMTLRQMELRILKEW